MDEQILALLRQQNEEGLRLLKRQYGNMLFYIAFGILQNRQDAEECVSDITLKIWEKHTLYRKEEGAFSAWLTAVARNAALNRRKRKSLSCSELTQEESALPSPEEEFLRRERAEQLKKALAALSSREQQLFFRKYYYLQSTAQIAAELGTTPRSVEGKLYRIRKKLQQMLGGEQP